MLSNQRERIAVTLSVRCLGTLFLFSLLLSSINTVARSKEQRVESRSDEIMNCLLSFAVPRFAAVHYV
jgi:hypothetical protein